MTPIDAEDVGLHSLAPKPGSRKARRRVGRGPGSGHGKTSGRGHKGAGARSGSKRKAAHEGGQNPIHMRTRKLRGPNKKMSMPFEPFRTKTQPVNVSDLEERFDAGAEVTPESLPPGQAARTRRADQEAHAPRPRVQRHGPREGREGGRDLRAAGSQGG